MKKLVTLLLATGFVLYLSSSVTYAFQGKGQGRRPAANDRQGRIQRPDRPGIGRRDDRRDDQTVRRGNRGTPGREDRGERIEDRLERNPELRTKLQGMLPA